MNKPARPEWKSPQKPAVYVENQLIDAILDGHFPIDSDLPAERELAAQLGVTRPTLREALQRLARDGWIEIHHGRPTRVRDYWHEGNLGILGAIVKHSRKLPKDFVPNLLEVRQLMAPAYTRMAVEEAPEKVVSLLQGYENLPERAEDFASADWELHYQLTIASGNPVFCMILNGFADFYHTMACIYFELPASREESRSFYAGLLEAAKKGDPELAEVLTRQMMCDSLGLWREAASQT